MGSVIRNHKDGRLPSILVDGKDYPLLKSQTETRRGRYNQSNLMPSEPLIYPVIVHNQYEIEVTGSDVEIYDVISVLTVPDAAYLLTLGINSADEALSFINRNGLNNLLVNNTDLVREALRRRIPALSLLRVWEQLGKSRTPSIKILLDAAEICAVKKLKHTDFYLDVLWEDTTIEAINTIGVNNIAKSESPHHIREILWDIRLGKITFSVEDFKTMILRTNKEQCGVRMLTDIAERFGTEYALGLHDFEGAHFMMLTMHKNALENKVADVEGRVKSVTAHYDAVLHARKTMEGGPDSPHWSKLNYPVAVGMHDAGIDPFTAWEAIRDGMTPQQVLAVQEHGIEVSVSGGWL